MSYVHCSTCSSDGDFKPLQQQQFVSLVEQGDMSDAGVRALLQSISTVEARSRLYQATREGFKGMFRPWWDDVWCITLL